MAVTAFTSWEGGLESLDSGAFSGTASYNTNATFVRTGARSLRCNPASGASGLWAYGAASPKYVHFALYIASLPSVARKIFGSGGSGTELKLNSTGTIEYLVSGATQGTSSVALGTGTWYWLGVRIAAGTSVTCLQIDSTDQITGSPDGTTNTHLGFSGTEASAVDCYFDDLVVDSAGFLATSKVDFALPISDNTVTGVTDGNGGTSNLWDCVNNIPPVGVASANEAANPTANIRFPASVAETYTANLETYTTLGVGASDTVLAVQSVIRHGEDISTGTKNGTLGAVSNPTIADSLAFAFGDDGGAHAAESGANVWITKFGTLTTSPSVTLGNSPTLTITRASQSRVGCVDFMGLFVVWTPAVVATVRVPRNPAINHQNPGIL